MSKLITKGSMIIYLLILSSASIYSQILPLYQNLHFIQAQDTLLSPFSGGLNLPQFSTIDWNGDQIQDLFVFDRSGNKTLSFIGENQNGEIVYKYAPEFQKQLPQLENWALLADYDCDGKPDLFSSNGADNGIKVYHNTSSNQEISFSLAESLLTTTGGQKIYTAASDLPAFGDVDEDGDLDILAFDPSGLFVRFFSRSGNQNCQDLNFELSEECWGGFMEAGLNNDILLNISCRVGGLPNLSNVRHAGSTICIIDMNGDGTKDILLGDLNYTNLVLVQNGGTPTSAQMTGTDTSFPSNSLPVDVFLFPASYHLDLDQDGKKDLIAAANAVGTAVNYHNILYYRNTSLDSTINLQYQSNTFLEESMVDCGESSYPVFFDYNDDNLLDLVVGNYLYREGTQSNYAGLTLYQNVGTPTLPVYELISRDYLQLSSLFNPQIFGLKPTFGDLDGDGDEDMILGDLDGKLHFFRNDAASGQEADFVLAEPQYQGIDVGQQAAPQLFDVNKDNLLDLVIGEQSGNLNYFENTGTQTNPVFVNGDNTFGGVDVQPACCTGFSVPFLFLEANGETQLLVAAESGEIFHYNQLDGNLTGTFNEISRQFGAMEEGTRASIHGADIDDDDFLEWVVGNRRGGLAIYEDLGQALSLEGKSIENPEWKIVPNPGKYSHILVEKRHSQNISLKLEVYNLSGQLLHTQKRSFQPQIRLPIIPPGLYFVELYLGEKYMGRRKWLVF